MKRIAFAGIGAAAVLLLGVGAAMAEDVPTFEITIQNHVFIPAAFDIPAGKDVRLVVKNLDKTPEEFESHDFSAEKIILGGGVGTFMLPPLEKGDYKFFGEFHGDTAQGVMTAK